MKPQTHLQKQVIEVRKHLPELTDAQVRWAYRHCIYHVALRSSDGVIACSGCSHRWQDEDQLLGSRRRRCHCPSCNTKLKIETAEFYDWDYLCIVTTCAGFQVLRFVWVECRMKAGEEPCYFHSEVVQRWIAPGGKHVTLARATYVSFASMRPANHIRGWNFESEMTLRPEKSLYNLIPTRVYPHPRYLPELTRRGYKGACGDLTQFDVMKSLLTQRPITGAVVVSARPDKMSHPCIVANILRGFCSKSVREKP